MRFLTWRLTALCLSSFSVLGPQRLQLLCAVYDFSQPHECQHVARRADGSGEVRGARGKMQGKQLCAGDQFRDRRLRVRVARDNGICPPDERAHDDLHPRAHDDLRPHTFCTLVDTYFTTYEAAASDNVG